MSTSNSQYKVRNVRVPDSLWTDAQAKAHSEGEVLSELIRHWLRTYVGDARTTGTNVAPDMAGESVRASQSER